MPNILTDLNEAQRKAVEYIDGPSLVIAGAGSGKTRVLTYKIAYLLEQGVKPWNILALTFTNKAANEMKERIGRLVGKEKAHGLYMGTFHSIFARILRAEAPLIGFASTFTIYDENDSRSLLKTIIKEMGLSDKQYKPAAVHAKISMAKNHLMSAETYASDHDIYQQNQRAQMPSLGKIYTAYVQRCRQANAMDFDDLLVYTFRLLRDNEEVCRRYAARFHFVLVDEYQDTNYAQQTILLLLCQERKRICAVGDDSQSIYSFRGANIDYILSFQKRFEGAHLFKLEQNYRSTQSIVKAANSLIKHNRYQIPKNVFSENSQGEPLLYKPAYSDREEAAIVAQEISRIKRQDECGYEDFAILYRTNAQSRSFEEEFRKNSIPYRIVGGLSFYQRKEIKDVIAYFRLVANPDDEEAFKRIINYPARGIGNTTLDKIAFCAIDHGVSFWHVLQNPVGLGLNVNKGTLTKLAAFRQLIEKFRDLHTQQPINELGRALIQESGISSDLYSSTDAEDVARQENLEEFLAAMDAFVAERQETGEPALLADYLQEVSLLSDMDSRKGDDSEPRVTLMTIHAAKGLEFPTVFVVGLEENIFPNVNAAASPRELEEERRLLYVAITRAEKHCILTSAQNRFRYGKMEFDNPSRFLQEIDNSLMDCREIGGTSRGGMDDEFGGSGTFGSGRSFGSSGGYGGRMPWDGGGRNATRVPWDKRSVSSQFKPDRKSFSPDDESHSPARTAHPSGFKPLRAVNAARRIMGADAATPASDSSQRLTAESLNIGDKVEHQRFGRGTVRNLEGQGENAKATIEFENAGVKQLLLKFAHLRRL